MTAPRFGLWKPLPEHASQPRIRPTQMIAHSIVGSARGAYGYFLRSTSIESHWIMTKGGEVWQLMDSDRRADANYLANRRSDGTGALSMETEDNGNPDRDPWTKAQLDALIDWFRWGHDTYGIPLTLCAIPDAPGVGYHTLHPRHWTNVRGKTCPGVVRKQQFHDLILPALAKPSPKELDVQPNTLVFILYGNYIPYRTPELGEVAHWVEVIDNGGELAAVDGIANSEEARNYRAKLKSKLGL